MPLVALVWSFVFYQLFSYFFSTPNYAKIEQQTPINIDEIKRDTFSIVANYRDPFLGKKRNSKQHFNKALNTRPRKSGVPKNIKAEKPWPIITYNGMIKNNNSDRRVGIVKINGKEYLVKEGDEINDVKFSKISKEEIRAKFQKERKTITK